MDFIARAGRMIDRAHRLAGFMLLLVLLETVLVFYLVGQNTNLNQSYEKLRNEVQVYVVPGSVAGFYSPRQNEDLLRMFVDHVTQSLNTYTPVTLEPQFAEISRFFTAETLEKAKDRFQKLLNVAKLDERSSLFIPDRRTIKIVANGGTKEDMNEKKTVTIDGRINYIISGNVVKEAPVRITLQIEQSNISRVNPFGYKLARYQEEVLAEKKEEEAPR